MIVIGIDPGTTRTGVVVMQDRDDPYAYSTFAAEDTAFSDNDRSRCIALQVNVWVWDRLEELHQDCGECYLPVDEIVVAIEKPVMGRSVKNFEKQMRTFQELVSSLQLISYYPIMEVNPKSAKAAAGGGNFAKLDIISASPFDGPGDWLPTSWGVDRGKVVTKLEYDSNQEAVADAWAIAACAYKKPPKHPRETRKACRGPIVERIY